MWTIVILNDQLITLDICRNAQLYMLFIFILNIAITKIKIRLIIYKSIEKNIYLEQ